MNGFQRGKVFVPDDHEGKEISFVIMHRVPGGKPFATFPNVPQDNWRLWKELHSNPKFGFTKEHAREIYQEAREHYARSNGIPIEEVTE